MVLLTWCMNLFFGGEALQDVWIGPGVIVFEGSGRNLGQDWDSLSVYNID